MLPPTDVTAQKTTVAVNTLDHLRQSWPKQPRIDFLKIDAQGHDLRILHGAARTIASDRPAILVEVIFVPLYEGQCSYFEIMQFMSERRYELAGIYQPHSTEAGLFAFADLLFLPADTHRRLSGRTSSRYVCLDADSLKQQIVGLQAACDDRLRVIHRLEAALHKVRPPKSAWRSFTARKYEVLQRIRAPWSR